MHSRLCCSQLLKELPYLFPNLMVLSQIGIMMYGGTMLPGCGKKDSNLSAGSPFEVEWHVFSVH